MCLFIIKSNQTSELKCCMHFKYNWTECMVIIIIRYTYSKRHKYQCKQCNWWFVYNFTPQLLLSWSELYPKVDDFSNEVIKGNWNCVCQSLRFATPNLTGNVAHRNNWWRHPSYGIFILLWEIRSNPWPIFHISISTALERIWIFKNYPRSHAWPPRKPFVQFTGPAKN